MKNFLIRFIFVLLFTFLYLFIFIIIFKPIFRADNVIFPYAIHPFDISSLYPNTWSIIKNLSLVFCIFSSSIISNSIYSIFDKFILNDKNNSPKIKSDLNYTNELSLLIGENENHKKIYIPEKGLFQNILVTRWYWNG